MSYLICVLINHIQISRKKLSLEFTEKILLDPALPLMQRGLVANQAWPKRLGGDVAELLHSR